MTPAGTAAAIFTLFIVMFVSFKIVTSAIKMALRLGILLTIVVLGGVAYHLWG